MKIFLIYWAIGMIIGLFNLFLDNKFGDKAFEKTVEWVPLIIIILTWLFTTLIAPIVIPILYIKYIISAFIQRRE